MALLLIFTQQVYSQEFNSPYKLSWGVDGPTFATGLIVAVAAEAINGNPKTLSFSEINVLNKKDVNAFDRIAVGNFSTKESKASDVLVGATIVSPLLLFVDESVRKDWETISTMYLETVLFSTFTPSLGKGSVKRIRPYVYSPRAPLSDKQDLEAPQSFFSGHTTWAFATGVLTASIYNDYFPESKYRTHVWIASLAVASSVALLRVTSGAHYPTDVLVGAAIGTGIGYIIPYLHRNISSPVSVNPIISPQHKGISFSLRF
ncbi:MAG: phosphatase PAP2 family protein [Bacteroidota bacterium]|nr:phosphatase PAP2 family protein [Bacteroidota bacterium]